MAGQNCRCAVARLPFNRTRVPRFRYFSLHVSRSNRIASAGQLPATVDLPTLQRSLLLSVPELLGFRVIGVCLGVIAETAVGSSPKLVGVGGIREIS